MTRFTELDTSAFHGAILIVDVDGTITNDRSHTLEPDAVRVLKELSQRNEVYLCSNGPDGARVRVLAEATGTKHLVSLHKKPSARVLQSVPHHEGKRVVVIGDKRLTDGRFAKNIGADFVHVQRITHADDRRHISAIYFLDDVYHRVGPYLHLMRPVQWIKNLLVFAPIFFADTAFSVGILAEAVLAFFAFCTAASAVYILNDIADRAQDRAHPIKRGRPLASGEVSLPGASALFLILIALSALLLTFIPAAIPVVAAYAVLNVLYSFWLKHIAVADILCVAVFYVMRVVAGGAAAHTYVSPWIVLCVLFGALVLVLGKRRAEFAHATRRRALGGYSKTSLDFLLAASATLAVVSYALYSVIGARSPLVVYSTVFVVFAVFRIVNRLFSDPEGDAEFPEKLLLKDRPALVAGLLWILYLFGILYL